MTFSALLLPALLLPLVASLGLLGPHPALAGSKGCPPGLAKKAVPCVPPAQAKKWRMGERLPSDVAWYQIDDWDRYGLPEPLDGSRYVRIDNEILRVAIATGIIAQVLLSQ